MEQVRRDRNEVEINLGDVFQILLSKWIYILLAGVLVAVAVGLITHFVIKKKYTASTSMYVFTTAEQNQTGSITSSELVAADNLIKTYQAIVKSNAALEVVSVRLNQEHPEYVDFNVTPARLNNMTSVNVPTGTKLLEIKVVTVNPQLSADIANTFAQYVPDEIIRITKAGGVEIVDYATAPKTHSSPSLTKNVAIGLLAGLVASAAFFVFRALLDTTIYSAEEIAKVTSCPVIGNIPHVEVAGEAPEPWNVSVKEEITHGN